MRISQDKLAGDTSRSHLLRSMDGPGKMNQMDVRTCYAGSMTASNAPTPVIRSQNAEMFVEDTDAGWAEMRVVVGEHDSGFYAFSLIWDPLEDIRQFERNLTSGEDARMLLRGEPGAVEVVATPVNPEGWVRLGLWLIDHRNARSLDFDAFCPASSLVSSMRTNIGFLAREYEQVKFEETRFRDIGRKLFAWLTRGKL